MIDWVSRGQAWLTRRYAVVRGGIVEESEYSACGVSRTVFWFDEESRRAGDYSPFGTILMNQTLPDGVSEEVQDYIFLHEVGHDELNPILRLLYWPVILFAFFLTLAGVIAFPAQLIRAIQWASDPVSLFTFLGMAVLVSTMACVPFVALSWADETYAELYAISHLGRNRYHEIRTHIRESRDPSMLRKLRHYIQYPPKSVVLWIAEWRSIGVEDSN